MWLLYAAGSAFFAGVTSVLAKCGIRTTDSTVATAIRTVVVLLFSWLMVAAAGSWHQIGQIDGETLFFLILSGAATGASWLCYFRALQIGDVNKVVPVDKASTVLTILLALLFLGEGVSLAKAAAVAVIAAGIWLMIERKEPGAEARGGRADSRTSAAARGGRADSRTSAAATGGRADSRTSTAATGGCADCRTSTAATGGRADNRASAAAIGGRADSRTSAAASGPAAGRGWFFYAAGSAVFASLTAILGKIGISGVESNLGTAIRTCVVLVMALLMTAVQGKVAEIWRVPKSELVFICLSGVATGASWLCYYRALQEGPASVVVPVDKLSVLVTAAFSYLVFGERLDRRAAAGLFLLTAGTAAMAVL